jgi:hypothetical protein
MRQTLLCSAFFFGCGAEPEEVRTAQGVAIKASDGPNVTIAYARTENSGELPKVLESTSPRNFPWVAITITDVDAAKMGTAEGLVIADASDPESGVIFSQVYLGPCNPALSDYSDCFLFEKYESGEPAFRGRFHLIETGSTISGFFDVSWEGLTDRFGEPLQQHRHETSAVFKVALKVVP